MVTRGDLSFETDSFTLKKGTETRVKVELLGDNLVVNGGGKVIAEQSIKRKTLTTSVTQGIKKPGTGQLTSTAIARQAGASGQDTVDLLAMIELPRDSEKHPFRGDWTREGKSLISPGNGKSGRIEIRYPLPSEYELTAVVQRMAGVDGVGFGVLMGDRRAEIGFDVYGDQISGITPIDGKSADDNETTFREKVLADRKTHVIQIMVEKRRLRASVDSREIIRWEGDPERLTMPSNSRHLTFSAAYHQFKFDKL